MSRQNLALAVLALMFAGCGSDSSGPGDGPLPTDLTLTLQPFVASGLSAPVFLAQPLGDGRIFVVEQTGRIRVIRDGVLQTTPFLDIAARIGGGGERGLLSVADGMLWTAFGDGGGGGDPLANGQNFNSLLGSLMRIDVNNGDPYAIPANNPFVGQAGRRGEIWAKGLRNPWRFAFDGPTGIVYIADVGQNAREEVNAQPITTAGLNYGWNITEGFICYNASTCNQAGLTAPAIDYPNPAGGCSVTGGYVYRGSAKDWGITSPGNVPSFGVDFAGEIYVIGGSSIYRIAAGS